MADKFIYVGRRIVKNSLKHCFIEQDSDDSTLTFWPKAKSSIFSGAKIGTVYEFKNGVPRLWSEAEIGESSEEMKLQWQGADRTSYLESIERKQSSSPELDEAIENLRHARSRLSSNQKMSFDIWVVNQISKR